MHFDVVFLDVTTPRPYFSGTLQTEPLGGSEASLIRVAEGLGQAGLKVGVFEHNLNQTLDGDFARYFPLDDIRHAKSISHLVAFRSNAGFDLFPQAKKYAWFEDEPDERYQALREQFVNVNATAIAVSEWHKKELTKQFCDAKSSKNPNIVCLSNPVPDEIYTTLPFAYDKNKLVWLSAPHKGLLEAATLFESLKRKAPDLRLHIFHPGYSEVEQKNIDGIVWEKPLPCAQVWQHVREALCVFYPTAFHETFGCIAAEANALGTPVATYPLAGLSETVSSATEFAPVGDNATLLQNVLRWHQGDRPIVRGQDKFKLSNVVKDWLKVLNP
jgi:glycosyltransferase involved in cell wall biosynthesis